MVTPEFGSDRTDPQKIKIMGSRSSQIQTRKTLVHSGGSEFLFLSKKILKIKKKFKN